jgi:hypothetical protein
MDGHRDAGAAIGQRALESPPNLQRGSPVRYDHAGFAPGVDMGEGRAAFGRFPCHAIVGRIIGIVASVVTERFHIVAIVVCQAYAVVADGVTVDDDRQRVVHGTCGADKRADRSKPMIVAAIARTVIISAIATSCCRGRIAAARFRDTINPWSSVVKGHWTLTDLSARKKSKDGTSSLSSFIGKMHDSYELFPNETERLSFVSNLPCQFMDASATVCCFSDCAAEEFAKFLAKLKNECPSATESTAKLMHFVRADLSLHDASAHLKGLMQDFVTSQLGTISYSPDTLYKTIIEECRTKSKYTGSIHTFEDLIKHKSITKSQVNGWLSQIELSHAVPNWSDFSNDLTYGAMEKLNIAKQ